MPRHNMPANWEPPAPAWQSYWKDTSEPLVAGYFGIQANEPALLDTWVSQAFFGKHAPFWVEQGLHSDRNGDSDYMYIAYWSQSEYQKWWALTPHSGWWDDRQRLADGVGYWREIITMPFERFETLHSTQLPHGIGVMATGMDGPIMEHGYPGSMRDRIPLSDTDTLRNDDGINARLQARTTDSGKRILVTPPVNMCVIRSGQNWSACGSEEKTHYSEKLHPVLLKGMRFLRDHPIETNCYALRFVDQKDDAWGATEKSFGLGYSVDVHAFENWAKSHPTHLAIFGGFLEMAETFGAEMKLALWHEVTALPEEGCEFEYIGCRPQTGLLGYI